MLRGTTIPFYWITYIYLIIQVSWSYINKGYGYSSRLRLANATFNSLEDPTRYVRYAFVLM